MEWESRSKRRLQLWVKPIVRGTPTPPDYDDDNLLFIFFNHYKFHKKTTGRGLYKGLQKVSEPIKQKIDG